MASDLSTRWRIGYMPYLNSAVFYQKLEGDWFDLVELPPRNMADAMVKGELDAGSIADSRGVEDARMTSLAGNFGRGV